MFQTFTDKTTVDILETINDYRYLIGEKHNPQEISPISIFSLLKIKKSPSISVMALLYLRKIGYAILAMFKFIRFPFSLLKGIYNTHNTHTSKKKLA